MYVRVCTTTPPRTMMGDPEAMVAMLCRSSPEETGRASARIFCTSTSLAFFIPRQTPMALAPVFLVFVVEMGAWLISAVGFVDGRACNHDHTIIITTRDKKRAQIQTHSPKNAPAMIIL